MARRKTSEGFIRADAVLTRAGEVEYLAGELGIEGRDGLGEHDSVLVRRTLETIGDQQTLDSLRGAPITFGHPGEGKVTPSNWRDTVVGSVVGEPRVVGDLLVADVLIGDEEALEELEAGVSELSIGYDFELLRSSDGTLSTVGGLQANHVALVGAGRSGPRVRVLDIKPEEKGDPKEVNMKPEDIERMVAKAVADALPSRGEGVDVDALASTLTTQVAGALAPAIEKITAIQTQMDEAVAKKEATKRITVLEEAVRKEERERYQVALDAMPLIPEDKQTDLDTADAKSILVMALQDHVPDAENQSVDYLRGALVMAKAQDHRIRKNKAGLPMGVRPVPKGGVDSARDDLKKWLSEAYKSGKIEPDEGGF